MTARALVSPRDRTAAATWADQQHSDPITVLFGHGSPLAFIRPQDHAAIGAFLTLNAGVSPAEVLRLLSLIRATGRTHLYAGGPRHLMHLGAIFLGGEIAARYLHQQLARREGTELLEPLARTITALWPLPRNPQSPGWALLGQTAVQRHDDAPSALLRLTRGPDRGVFAAHEAQAMQALAHAASGGGRQIAVAGIARLAGETARYQSKINPRTVAAVRGAIAAGRGVAHPQHAAQRATLMGEVE